MKSDDWSKKSLRKANATKNGGLQTFFKNPEPEVFHIQGTSLDLFSKEPLVLGFNG